MLDNLDNIAERLLNDLSDRNAVRDRALLASRNLVRFCANAIRAVHREEKAEALSLLAAAREVAQELRSMLADYPDIYYAGYTQDAMKEYVEANITYSVLHNEALPEPEALGAEAAAYFCGMGEAVGEMRRRVLDAIRRGHLQEGERVLGAMEEIFSVLVTVDFPEALTGGLRRITDMARGVLERTRGDLTMAMQQETLRQALRDFESRLNLHDEGEVAADDR